MANYSRDDQKPVEPDQRTGRVRITGLQKRATENGRGKVLARILAIGRAQRELSEIIPRRWWPPERS
jgi:hypothetical protein